MIKTEAEKLVCPFMGEFEKVGDVSFSMPKKCITDKCMAWKITGYEIKDKIKCDSGICQRLN